MTATVWRDNWSGLGTRNFSMDNGLAAKWTAKSQMLSRRYHYHWDQPQGAPHQPGPGVGETTGQRSASQEEQVSLYAALHGVFGSCSWRELRSFLGLVNYYGRFLPNVPTVWHPLNRLLRKAAGWLWTRKCQDAFQAMKEMLSSDLVLA